MGTVLGNNYIIGKALGQGGFGITYVAWDPALLVRRAIKEYYPIECAARAPNQHTISPYTGEAEENFSFGLDRFMDEAQKLAKFQDHPHIVTVLGYFRANHTAYMVMDYLPGKTLENYLRDKGGRIPYSTAKDIMVRVMDALRAVHGNNLLHRDVSPQNIYITDDGKVKLLDFGSARQATGSHSQSLTLMIKHGYSPGEQYSKTGHQAAWTDVYATGATFYRAITGEIPPEALLRMKRDLLRPISEFCDDVPERAERAIVKALAVDAEDRFQTIKAFQDEIVAPESPAPVEPDREPQPSNKSSMPLIVAAAVLALLVGGGSAAWFTCMIPGVGPDTCGGELTKKKPIAKAEAPRNCKGLDADACYGAAKTALEAKDLELARQLYQQAAKLGAVPANLRVAEMYDPDTWSAETSPEETADWETAAYWYEEAARQGNVQGQIGAGRVLCRHAPDSFEQKRGLKFLGSASEQGAGEGVESLLKECGAKIQ